MSDFVKKYGRNSILISVLLIVLSLFLIFAPSTSLKIIVMGIGIILAANGVFHMVSYFSSPQELKILSYELAIGVISLLIGIIFIFNPTIVDTFISYIIAGWIILKSITSIQLAFNMKASTDKWVITLILAIFTLLLGIVLLFNPFATAALISACGIILLISEIANILEVSNMMYYIK